MNRPFVLSRRLDDELDQKLEDQIEEDEAFREGLIPSTESTLYQSAEQKLEDRLERSRLSSPRRDRPLMRSRLSPRRMLEEEPTRSRMLESERLPMRSRMLESERLPTRTRMLSSERLPTTRSRILEEEPLPMRNRMLSSERLPTLNKLLNKLEKESKQINKKQQQYKILEQVEKLSHF